MGGEFVLEGDGLRAVRHGADRTDTEQNEETLYRLTIIYLGVVMRGARHIDHARVYFCMRSHVQTKGASTKARKHSA